MSYLYGYYMRTANTLRYLTLVITMIVSLYRHITTHRRFYREQLGLGLPKSCPKSLARLSEGTSLNMIFKTLPDILSFCCNNDLRACRKITPMFQCTTYHLKVNRSSFERTTNAFFAKIKDNWVVFQALNVKTHMENDPLIIRMILRETLKARGTCLSPIILWASCLIRSCDINSAHLFRMGCIRRWRNWVLFLYEMAFKNFIISIAFSTYGKWPTYYSNDLVYNNLHLHSKIKMYDNNRFQIRSYSICLKRNYILLFCFFVFFFCVKGFLFLYEMAFKNFIISIAFSQYIQSRNWTKFTYIFRVSRFL
jgi:hypothetical protein